MDRTWHSDDRGYRHPPQLQVTYWARIFPDAAVTPLDIFSIIQPDHVRELRASQPRNLALTIIKAASILDDTIAAPTAKGYPRLLNAVRIQRRGVSGADNLDAPQTHMPSSGYVATSAAVNARTHDARISPLQVRLLTRVLPIVLETTPASGDGAAGSDDEGNGDAAASAAGDSSAKGGDDFVLRLFWRNEIPRAVPPVAGDAPETPPPITWESRSVGGSDAIEPFYPLGAQLVHCTMAAMFLPDLTLDRSQVRRHSVV